MSQKRRYLDEERQRHSQHFRRVVKRPQRVQVSELRENIRARQRRLLVHKQIPIRRPVVIFVFTIQQAFIPAVVPVLREDLVVADVGLANALAVSAEGAPAYSVGAVYELAVDVLVAGHDCLSVLEGAVGLAGVAGRGVPGLGIGCDRWSVRHTRKGVLCVQRTRGCG